MSTAERRYLLCQIPGALLAIPTGGASLLLSMGVGGFLGCAHNEWQREQEVRAARSRYSPTKR